MTWSPRATRSAPGCAADVDRLRPGHPSPILPYVCGSEAHALEAAAALLDQGLLVTAIRPPTVPVGTSRLFGSRSPPRTPTSRSTVSPTRWRRCSPARDPAARRARVRRGYRDGCREDLVDRGSRGELRARGVQVSARQAGAVRLGAADRRRRPRGALTGEDPETGCRPHRRYELGVGATHGRGRARRPAVLGGRPGCRGRRGRTVAVGFVEGAGGPARCSRRTATTSTSRECWRPIWWCWSPTPASAPSTRYGSPRRRSSTRRSSSRGELVRKRRAPRTELCGSSPTTTDSTW